MKRRRAVALFVGSGAAHVTLFMWVARTPPTLRLPPEPGGPVTEAQIIHLAPRRQARSADGLAPAEAERRLMAPRAAVVGAAQSIESLPLAAAPQVAAKALPHPGCSPEVRMLLTEDERRECEVKAAVASGRARGSFRAAEAVGDRLSTIRPGAREQFEGELARKTDRSDVDAAQAALKQFWADGPARAAPAWAAGPKQGGVAIQVRCTVRFSGWKIEDRPPECRFGASSR